ncbi:putative HET-domain-containing protein [Rosellinia necatrix]|uniref:Putative HET-domain-containing protein n=1 Tax=Rosellinia necatrix TaxID=77044 RepID=A0A1W2TCQ4_ROSNE|nr:putative HET-domain-containing protein [Rosellinia necatrix]
MQQTGKPAAVHQASLCEGCWAQPFSKAGFQRLFGTTKSKKSSQFTYTTSWSGLNSSAGCNWCELLLSSRNESDKDDALKVTIRIERRGSPSTTPDGVQIMKVFMNDEGSVHIVGYIYSLPDDPLARYVKARDRLLETDSPEAFQLALQAVKECVSKHDHCPSHRESKLPTRVLSCSNPSRPILVETGNARGSYVALSYVWGEPQQHSLTSSNITSYLGGIDSSILPQTIKDAVLLCHHLKCQYLWIDSLCILQDSDEDKMQEIARMRSIYRDSYFTIVAANANKVSQGFLLPRAPLSPPATLLSIQLPDGQGIGTFYFALIWKDGVGTGVDGEQYDAKIEPVNSRAWCYQEYVLSPRILLFASHTAQYHCQTTTLNLGNAYCDSSEISRLPNIVFTANETSDAVSPRRQLSPEEWKDTREAWFSVISNYTERFVTVSSDKLVALAGISELFHGIWDTPYRAGLWEDTLFEDLFWHKRPSNGALLPRPKKYRAPSWSWASIDGAVEAALVRWSPSHGSSRCEIVESHVELDDSRLPFGGVVSGTLVIRAPMVKATWTPHKRKNYVYSLPSEGVPDNNTTACDLESSDEEPTCLGVAWIDSSEDTHVRDIWAVPLMWTEPIHMTGLILALAKPGEKQYRRVGFLTTHAAAENIDWVSWTDPVEITIE